MAKIIEMPKMGNTVESVILSEIFVKEGQEVKKGDNLFSYETDKTTTEEEAKEAGHILKIFVKENDEIAVFSPVLVIGKKGEDIKKIISEVEAKAKKVEEPKIKIKIESKVEVPKALPKIEAPAPSQTTPNRSGASDTGTGGISPRALKALRRSGIPLSSVSYGSGPRGRITANDVHASKKRVNFTTSDVSHSPMEIKVNEIIGATKSSKGDEEFKYPPMRAAISKGVFDSQKNSVATTLTIAVDAAKLLSVRAIVKQEMATGGPNISINDLIVYALSRVLPKYKNTINAHAFDTKGIAHGHANIAIAVDTKDGLVVPVIKETNLKTLQQISEEAKFAITQARAGNYKDIDLKSGTFTISNVGAMNIEVFTPVLNAGQSGILGVGGVALRPRKSKDGLIEFYNSMILSLTVDHRIADGADGARFLNDIKLVLENIDLII
jgi:pyruvate dehydrogenase E2 component (dihydrolipoamide acetyltransferase)